MDYPWVRYSMWMTDFYILFTENDNKVDVEALKKKIKSSQVS